ncbi:hypothetical protein L218DRAFT_873744, partial [Marasmius fiardii PR-910]
RISILKLMLCLSKESRSCPKNFIIKEVEKLGDFPVRGGSSRDVWKGKVGQVTVCLKKWMREAVVWRQLKHPNILPLMGIHYLSGVRDQFCLVSPWMERGNLVQFLTATPSEDVDHYSLVYDVIAGLSYLHSLHIIHGSLKSVSESIILNSCFFIISIISSIFWLPLKKEPVSEALGHPVVIGGMLWIHPQMNSRDGWHQSSSVWNHHPIRRC